MLVLIGLVLVLVAIWLAARSLPPMTLLVAALGALTYAAVPAMQARVIGIAERHASSALAAAADSTSPGSMPAIALGSLVGGGVIAARGVSTTALVGAGAAVLGLGVLTVSRGRP